MMRYDIQESKVHYHLSPRNAGKVGKLRLKAEDITMDAVCGTHDTKYAREGLNKLGLGISKEMVSDMVNSRYIRHAMDSIQASVTSPSVTVPVQFLQFWVPGFVYVMTAARKIDDLVGMTILGSWEDTQIVQPLMELEGGAAVPYGDTTNVPYSDYNVNYPFRTVVRFEEGINVGQLESKQAARARIDTASQKRQAAMLELEITRNLIGFYGYNAGVNITYGFLNDPGLPAYITVPAGASLSTLWANKTFLEIQADINNSIVQLRTQSLDNIDPEKVDITLALPTDAVDQLSKTSDFGISVRDWLKQAYPRIRPVSAPQLDNANGGANVFYLYAENIDDMSTDGGKVFDQWVPMKFMTLGVEQRAKAYLEDYSNALAGVICKRPWAVVRYSGI